MLMWPFFWHLKSDYPTFEKESTYIIPFYYQHWRKGKEENARSSRRLKIWPLYEWQEDEDGSTRSRMLSPFWFEDYLPNGVDKAWRPLFTLFDYGTGVHGEKDYTVLGPLYNYKKRPDSTYHRVLFFSYKDGKEEKEGSGRFSVLGGLFEYEWDQEEKGLRFFYLPQWPTWGEKESTPKTENTSAPRTQE